MGWKRILIVLTLLMACPSTVRAADDWIGSAVAASPQATSLLNRVAALEDLSHVLLPDDHAELDRLHQEWWTDLATCHTMTIAHHCLTMGLGRRIRHLEQGLIGMNDAAYQAMLARQADLGSGLAATILAIQQSRQDDSRALQTLLALYDDDRDPLAAHELSMRLLRLKRYDLAGLAALRAAEQDNADAQHMMGLLHFQGLGVDKDAATGRRWFLMAIQLGHVPTANSIAMFKQDGNNGYPKDLDAALSLLHLSMRHDENPLTYQAMGRAYDQGLGVDTDCRTAKAYYSRGRTLRDTTSEQEWFRLDHACWEPRSD